MPVWPNRPPSASYNGIPLKTVVGVGRGGGKPRVVTQNRWDSLLIKLFLLNYTVTKLFKMYRQPHKGFNWSRKRQTYVLIDQSRKGVAEYLIESRNIARRRSIIRARRLLLSNKLNRPHDNVYKNQFMNFCHECTPSSDFSTEQSVPLGKGLYIFYRNPVENRLFKSLFCLV